MRIEVNVKLDVQEDWSVGDIQRYVDAIFKENMLYHGTGEIRRLKEPPDINLFALWLTLVAARSEQFINLSFGEFEGKIKERMRYEGYDV